MIVIEQHFTLWRALDFEMMKFMMNERILSFDGESDESLFIKNNLGIPKATSALLGALDSYYGGAWVAV